MVVNNISRGKDALLIFPPPYIPTELQPGIAAIAAYAEHEGLSVEVVDANIGGLEYLLDNKDSAVHEAIQMLKDRDSYTPEKFEKFRAAKDAIAKASQSLSNGEKISIHRNTMLYIPHDDAQSRAGILAALEHASENLFSDYFATILIPELQKRRDETGYSVIGIGITDRKQAIPGFILARMIKEQLPDVKVVVGGNFISRARTALSTDDELNRKILENVDYLIYLEGDKSFAKLVKSIREGTEILDRSQIDKLIWKEDAVQHNPQQEVIDVRQLPVPNIKGLQHWTPAPVVSYNFQRGCNYGKCGFCGLMDGYDSYSHRSAQNPMGFVSRRKGIDAIVADLKALYEEGIRYVDFTDETFFAGDMEKIAKRILEEKIDIKWKAYARVEQKYADPKFTKLIAQAGCEELQFGVESASVKSLQMMLKGVDNANVYEVLQSTHTAGIRNHVFLLVGYPGETMEEALRLFPFLEQAQHYTSTIKPTWFKLARGSPDAFKPEIKGLQRTYTEGDLAANLHYVKTDGMQKGGAEAVNELLTAWARRYHTMNYVAGTYMYNQRFFIGTEGLRQIAEDIDAGKIARDPEFSPEAEYTKREKQAMHTVWRALVGEEYAKAQRKYEQGNRNPPFLKAYTAMQQQNMVAKEYPYGFQTVDDVARVAHLLHSE